MQKIERYGVIALILLVITFVTVTFWGDEERGGSFARSDADATAERKRGSAMSASARRVARPESEPAVNGRRSVPLNQPVSVAPQMRGRNPVGQGGDGILPDAVLTGARSGPPRGEPVGAGADDPLFEMRPPRRPARNHAKQPIAALEPVVPSTSIQRPSTTAPVTSPATTAVTSSTTDSYRVRSGDTLSLIAQKTLGTSRRWKEIQAINGSIDPRNLVVGMLLRLPRGATSGTPAVVAQERRTPPKQAAPPPAGTRTYVVKKGDLLSTIAQRELGSARRWREIQTLNGNIDPKRVYVGTVLKLPAAPGARPVALATNTTPRRTSPGDRVARPRSQSRTGAQKPRVR